MNHIHKYYKSYYRAKSGHTRFTWMCSDSVCTHFMPHNMVITQLKSKCWGCDAVFMITSDVMHMDKPVCNECLEGIVEHVE